MRVGVTTVLALMLTMLAGCSRVPEGTFLLPPSQGQKIAKLCSRRSFAADSYWQVTPQQAVDFENNLRDFLAQPAHAELAKMLGPLSAHHRQLIGYTMGNKNYLYANFYIDPAHGEIRAPVKLLKKAEQARAISICDGGSRYWGATQNLQIRAIESVDTNGVIGGGACHWDFSGPLQPSKETACECINTRLMVRPLPPLPAGLSYCPSI